MLIISVAELLINNKAFKETIRENQRGQMASSALPIIFFKRLL
jgi:Tfp pilus assembly pilus retraction ATPase PilT